MKIILVPTDFSDHALYALRVASNIARKLNARIWLLHSSYIPSFGIKDIVYYENFYQNLRERAESELANLLGQDFLTGIEVEKFLISDRPVWHAIQSGKFSKPALIVIGSHGRSGFNRLMVGSNAEKIVRLAKAPVLTIKKNYLNFNINKIIFASDFSDEVSRVVPAIKFFARIYRAQLLLLKVITPSEFESTPVSYKLMSDFKKEHNFTRCSVNIYNHNSIIEGILDFSQETHADMIIIPTHGRTGFAHLINGSLAESLAFREPKPVLSIKFPVKEVPPIETPPEASIYHNLEFF